MFSGTPTLPFAREEHLSRQAILRRAVAAAGFDAILVFAQESHFWLTGYDSGGFVFFQCAVVTADDTPITLLTRRPDLLQVVGRRGR
jgi:Xaa-Pro dipeptidase